MNKIKQVLFLATLFIGAYFSSEAQVKIGNNPTSILPGSLLELESTNKALTLPRLTTAQMNSFPSPVNGMVIYNSTEGCVFQYNDNIFSWESLCNNVEPWYNKANSSPSESLMDQIYHIGSANVGTGIAPGNYSMTVGLIDTVIGQLSFACGIKNKILADAAMAVGFENLIDSNADQSFASGGGNVIDENRSVAMGSENYVNASFSQAFGWKDSVLGGGWHCAIGASNVCDGLYTTAIGRRNRIINSNSAWALGYENIINGGGQSLTLGSQNTTTGALNVALGNNCDVYGSSSMALGTNCKTGSVQYQMALGTNSEANAAYSNAIGSNALANHQSSTVICQSLVPFSSTGAYQLSMKFQGGYRLLSNGAGTVGVQLPINATTWSSISDRRSKENISGLTYGLETVMRMKPSSYNYKTVENKNLGFIAQDMRELVPEVVDVPENEDEMMSIRYTELIPVLTKAIQELKTELDAEKANNKSLVATMEKKDKSIADLYTMIQLMQDDVTELKDSVPVKNNKSLGKK